MTDISEADEREAREWLEREFRLSETALPGSTAAHYHKCSGTILALLDRPVMPKPEDVPGGLLETMSLVHLHSSGAVASMRAAYRALYDHYNPKPKPKKPWAVISNNVIVDWCATQADAERIRLRHPGLRIVRLVEADHD